MDRLTGSNPDGSTSAESASAGSSSSELAVIGVFLASGIAAVAGTFLASGPTDGFVVVAGAEAIIAILPDAIVTWGILSIAEYSRGLVALLAAVGSIAALAAVAAGGASVANRYGLDTSMTLLSVGGLQAIAVFAVTTHVLSALAAGTAGALTLAVGRRGILDGYRPPGRRQLLKSVGAAGVTIGLGWVIGSRPPPIPDEEVTDPGVLAMLEAASERSFEFDRDVPDVRTLPPMEPLVSENFFQVDINLTPPLLERDEWELSIEGGPTEFTVDYETLTARDSEHRFITLRCVSDPLNGDTIDTALWTGTPIDDLLAEADAPESCCVFLEAADGYYHAFPREALERGFLAWRMNGKLLPRGHGHPVRALIPGHWGEINVKWITRIEILDEPATGYWEERGWHGSGPVETVAKLNVARPGSDGAFTVGGHAYAGTRGVSRVEVSTDGGENWNEATLSKPLPAAIDAAAGRQDESVELTGTAADAWRMWRYEYEPTEPHEVVVRAVEADGTVQPSEKSAAFPSGASGWVRREIDPT